MDILQMSRYASEVSPHKAAVIDRTGKLFVASDCHVVNASMNTFLDNVKQNLTFLAISAASPSLQKLFFAII
jgi:hypothetical protein